MSTDVNPYAPPKAHVDDVSGAPSEVEAIRREHIKHEASIRSIGTLYYVGGAFMLLSGTAMVVVVDPTEPLLRPLGAFYLLLSARGRRIFAADYADIVAATPHVKYRTSIAVWIALGALLLMTALIVGLGMLAG